MTILCMEYVLGLGAGMASLVGFAFRSRDKGSLAPFAWAEEVRWSWGGVDVGVSARSSAPGFHFRGRERRDWHR